MNKTVYNKDGSVAGSIDGDTFRTRMTNIFKVFNAVSLDEFVLAQIRGLKFVSIAYMSEELIGNLNWYFDETMFFRLPLNFLERNPHVHFEQRLVLLDKFWRFSDPNPVCEVCGCVRSQCQCEVNK